MNEAPRIQRCSESAGETTRALPTGGALVVANTVGEIVLRGSTRSDLRIAWIKRGTPGTPEWDALELEIGQTSDRVSVRPRHPARGTRPADAWLDLEIEIPAAAGSLGLEIENGAGDVTASDVSCGTLRLAIASGDARLGGIAADARIQSASGDVAATGYSGNLAVRTASGDVAILGHRHGAATIETASGGVRWRPDRPSDARIRTVSGDIVAELPQGGGWRIELRSVSGAASLPPRFGPAGRTAWLAPADGTAQGSLEARTVSGDLGVVEIPMSATDAGSPQRKRPPRDRNDILLAVERGDLGVDDALRLLDDLAGGAQPA